MKYYYLPKILNQGLNQLWTTPVYYGKIDNQKILNKASQFILENFNLLKPPSDFDEVNILESSATMIEFKNQIVEPAFEEYLNLSFNLSLKQFEDYNYKSWIAGSKKGYSIYLHNHSGSQFAAVFYLLCEADQGGTLTMADPRVNANRGYNIPFTSEFSNVDMNPTSGSYVIMPSYVYHYTDMFQGSLRLAIPVDLFLGPFKS